MRMPWIAGASCAVALAASLPATTRGQETQGQETLRPTMTATVAAPARLDAGEAPHATANVYLDIAVSAYRTPKQTSVEAVVALTRRGTGESIEVGRFAVFPHAPFTARGPEDQRRYRFNVTTALSGLKPEGPVGVTVTLVPLDPGASGEGAAMTFADARLVAQ